MCGSPSFLDFDDCFLPILGKYSANVISSNTFQVLLSLSFPPGNPIANGVFDIVPDVSKQSSFIFIIYSLPCQDFHHSVFYFTYLFFSFIYLLLITPSVFFISVFIFFSSGYSLYFIFIKSFL